MKDHTAVGVNLEATVQGMAVVESWSRSYQPQFEVEPDQKQIPSNQQSQPKCLQGWGSRFTAERSKHHLQQVASRNGLDQLSWRAAKLFKEFLN